MPNRMRHVIVIALLLCSAPLLDGCKRTVKTTEEIAKARKLPEPLRLHPFAASLPANTISLFWTASLGQLLRSERVAGYHAEALAKASPAYAHLVDKLGFVPTEPDAIQRIGVDVSKQPALAIVPSGQEDFLAAVYLPLKPGIDGLNLAEDLLKKVRPFNMSWEFGQVAGKHVMWVRTTGTREFLARVNAVVMGSEGLVLLVPLAEYASDQQLQTQIETFVALVSSKQSEKLGDRTLRQIELMEGNGLLRGVLNPGGLRQIVPSDDLTGWLIKALMGIELVSVQLAGSPSELTFSMAVVYDDPNVRLLKLDRPAILDFIPPSPAFAFQTSLDIERLVSRYNRSLSLESEELREFEEFSQYVEQVFNVHKGENPWTILSGEAGGVIPHYMEDPDRTWQSAVWFLGLSDSARQVDVDVVGTRRGVQTLNIDELKKNRWIFQLPGVSEMSCVLGEGRLWCSYSIESLKWVAEGGWDEQPVHQRKHQQVRSAFSAKGGFASVLDLEGLASYRLYSTKSELEELGSLWRLFASLDMMSLSVKANGDVDELVLSFTLLEGTGPETILGFIRSFVSEDLERWSSPEEYPHRRYDPPEDPREETPPMEEYR